MKQFLLMIFQSWHLRLIFYDCMVARRLLPVLEELVVTFARRGYL
jgi:hypothetical protein